MARDRVKYDRNAAYQRLVDDNGVFNSYVDFFMFCAALGYSRDEKIQKAYEGAEHELLWLHIEGTELFEMVSKSIAYQETGDPDVLDNQSNQLEILAEYAAAGADIADEEFTSIGNEADLPKLIAEFILEEGPEATDEELESDLSGLL